MKNLPKKIYLVIPDDVDRDDIDFNHVADNNEVTWCEDDINGDGLEYTLTTEQTEGEV